MCPTIASLDLHINVFELPHKVHHLNSHLHVVTAIFYHLVQDELTFLFFVKFIHGYEVCETGRCSLESFLASEVQ